MSEDKAVTKKVLDQAMEKNREEMKDLLADTVKVIMEFVRDENKKTRVEFEEFVRDENKKTRVEFEEFVQGESAETRNHFDAVAETIHQDLAGANKDEITGIQNKQDNHEDRITHLEERAGVR